MKKIINKIQLLVVLLAAFMFVQCESEDANSIYIPPVGTDLTHPNDLYLYSNVGKSLFEIYGTAVRWRWNDNFIDPSQRAAPIDADFVIPTTELIEYLWIGPYASVGKPGIDFLNELFPSELQYMGSYIFQEDGTRILGFAEGGARISLLNLNNYDLKSRDWLTNAGGGVLATVHHEFSHIVHQNYGIPVGFNTISESYLGAGWSNGVTQEDAVKLGMTRNYGTLNEFEDFCEIISHFLVMPKADFEEQFITQQDCSELTTAAEISNCQDLNEGRVLIKRKLELVIEFYKNTFDMDLVQVRDTLESRLNYVIANNKIP
ncbi:MAG: hypothetical protein KBH29_11010 [Lutibacter sp.]|nr:hypothetical protein [Lutibacter sp.]